MRAVLLVLLGVCLSLSVGCENPLEIDRETEIEIGLQGGADLEKQYGVVKDAAMQKRLDAIGARVAAVSEEPDLPWTFKILDSEEVNAVALPGGPVYVMRGMMEYAKSDDQLAGVMAHEVVHADHHHAKTVIEKAMTEQLLAELVLQKSSDSIRQAAGIALDLEMRQGYREKEYESDEFGTKYAFRAGYRATGLRDLLSYLHEKEGDPARITWLLQSHPPLSKRIERLDGYIPTLTGKAVSGS
ncbi:MAG: M48 family metalloprotease [Armatimonadetes bacterium]|nr:M48 family metalloprotease [Armatimonadota bacterium]